MHVEKFLGEHGSRRVLVLIKSLSISELVVKTSDAFEGTPAAASVHCVHVEWECTACFFKWVGNG